MKKWVFVILLMTGCCKDGDFKHMDRVIITDGRFKEKAGVIGHRMLPLGCGWHVAVHLNGEPETVVVYGDQMYKVEPGE